MLAPRYVLFRLMNGLAAFYKPPNMNTEKFISFMKRQLSEDFNSLPGEPPSTRILLRPSEGNPRKMILSTVPDIVDSNLVIGKTFYPGDFMIYPIESLDDMVSGVQDGVLQMATNFEQTSWLKTYHLTGMLGRASTDGTSLGATLLRSSWRHVTRQKLERVLAGLQAQCRSSILLQAGLRPNSQTAYLALASRMPGQDLRCTTATRRLDDLYEREHLLPPWERDRSLGAQTSGMRADKRGLEAEESRRKNVPCVHSLKCIRFEPPYFTLEALVSCETFPFLVNLVANLGPRLRSTTLLSHARRVRHGRITTEDALLFKHCHVPDYLITRLNDYVHREREGADEYGIPDQLTKSSANHSDLLNVLISDRDHTESPNLFTSLQICSKLGAPSNYVASQISTHLTPV
ncbi:putative tRNA pseudouridine synthase [Fasciolopsis buskii]|uniref:Putative tRNA pseudouridine synthase n=1 Tax=Fasciolopsis buskii TaxID=27845 RepID=A0A8E0RLC3_9TREM|nr:putative tRNA pseudouridine synthase [Fasciolopsis buski]